MQPREFGQALCIMPADALRQAAALVHLTTGDLGRELFKGNLGTLLERAIRSRETALVHRSREELILLTLTRLMERLEVPMRELGTHRTLLDAAEDVADAALHRLQAKEKAFHGTTFDDMIRWQVERLVTGTNRRAEKDPEVAARMREALDEYARKLPPEQQARLGQQLGVTELTRETLMRAAQTGALGGAFYATVQAAGFAAYTTLSSALASLSGAVGLTLPFGAYTFASSALAILSSPLFVGPATLVAVGIGWRKIAAHLDTHLPATMVGLAILQRYAAPHTDPDPALHAAARTWTELRQRWQASVTEQTRLQNHLESLEAAKRRRKEQHRALSQARMEAQALAAALQQAGHVDAKVAHHPHWESQLTYLIQECAESVAEAERQIQSLDQEIRKTRQRLDQTEQDRRAWEEPIQAIVGTFERRG